MYKPVLTTSFYVELHDGRGLGGGVRSLQDFLDQRLDIRFAGGGIHARELQACMVADAGVADHGSSDIEELSPDARGQLI
jgi:hypothetical protein